MNINKGIFMSGMVVALLLLPCHAQTKDGGISADMLKEIQQSQKLTTADKALFNAVASNSIDNLAQNYANQGALDTYFSVETKSQNITDQKQSGRCWMFSGFNVIRSNFANRTDSLRVDLSHAYLFFWDQLEKSNLFLQGVIDCASKLWTMCVFSSSSRVRSTTAVHSAVCQTLLTNTDLCLQR